MKDVFTTLFFLEFSFLLVFVLDLGFPGLPCPAWRFFFFPHPILFFSSMQTD